MPKPKLLGFWMCTALVVGNMIGSGIFLMPASLAPYGLNSVIAWLPTALGAIVLSFVFAYLSKAFPHSGGPYAYTRAAFGDFPAFVVAWGYWVSVWVGNVSIATGAVAYLSALMPWIATVPGASALVTLFFLWLMTLVNCLGVREMGWVQMITTVMKLMPLLAIAIFGIFYLRPVHLEQNSAIPLSMSGVTASATIALFALMGLESATIPADKVENPSHTIPRATLIGTIVTAIIYIISCSVVLILLPTARLSASNAPFAEVATLFWGSGAGKLLALFAAISGFGALNGWILLQGEVPHAMANDGVFFKPFAQESRRGTPTFALVFTSGLVSILVLATYQQSMVSVFTFMVLLSTTACLIMYLLCAVALLKLWWEGKVQTAGRRSPWIAAAGVVGGLYALWTIYGASQDPTRVFGHGPLFWGFMLLLVAVPLFFLMRLGRPSSPPMDAPPS